MNQKKCTILIVLLWALFLTHTSIAQRKFDFNNIQKPILKNDTFPYTRNLLYEPAKDGKPLNPNLLYVPVRDGKPKTILLSNNAILTHLNPSIENKMLFSTVKPIETGSK